MKFIKKYQVFTAKVLRKNKIKVLHIIIGLGYGGAEAGLYRLITNSPQFTHLVISLKEDGYYSNLLKYKDIKVVCLNLNKKNKFFIGICKLILEINNFKPNILHNWMYHANFMGGIIGKLLRIDTIIWTIHGSFHIGTTKLLTNFLVRLSALFSYFIPDKIVYVSNYSHKVHLKLGYSEKNSVVIPNGYSLNNRLDKLKGTNLIKNEFNLSDEIVILGVVTRYHPVKDFKTLICALSELKKKYTHFVCLIVGFNIPKNEELEYLIRVNKLEDYIILVGPRIDINSFMLAFDIFVLSSLSESSPNVIFEAMACGTPCVSTDVGDVSEIIGQTGWIVPISDSISLAESIFLAINEMNNSIKWELRRRLCKERIELLFSSQKMYENYHNLWLK